MYHIYIYNIFFFLFLHENVCCWYSLKAPPRGASNEYHNTCFHREVKKYQYFSIDFFKAILSNIFSHFRMTQVDSFEFYFFITYLKNKTREKYAIKNRTFQLSTVKNISDH